MRSRAPRPPPVTRRCTSPAAFPSVLVLSPLQVTNNVFFIDRPLARTFDLKGASHDRFVPETEADGACRAGGGGRGGDVGVHGGVAGTAAAAATSATAVKTAAAAVAAGRVLKEHNFSARGLVRDRRGECVRSAHARNRTPRGPRCVCMYRPGHILRTRSRLPEHLTSWVPSKAKLRARVSSRYPYPESNARLFVGPAMRLSLLRQLDRDCRWLEEHNLIDYSLLVGVVTAFDSSAEPSAQPSAPPSPQPTPTVPLQPEAVPDAPLAPAASAAPGAALPVAGPSGASAGNSGDAWAASLTRVVRAPSSGKVRGAFCTCPRERRGSFAGVSRFLFLAFLSLHTATHLIRADPALAVLSCAWHRVAHGSVLLLRGAVRGVTRCCDVCSGDVCGQAADDRRLSWSLAAVHASAHAESAHAAARTNRSSRRHHQRSASGGGRNVAASELLADGEREAADYASFSSSSSSRRPTAGSVGSLGSVGSFCSGGWSGGSHGSDGSGGSIETISPDLSSSSSSSSPAKSKAKGRRSESISWQLSGVDPIAFQGRGETCVPCRKITS